MSIALGLLAGPALGQTAQPDPQPGEWRQWSSIIEPSKYGENFTQYDYVNPDAPKGGTLNLATSGSFDSFNPFVLRGTAAAGFAAFGGGLAYDTLMDQALDEPGVSHGLIAEAMQYPADYSSVSFRLDPDARWHDGQPITVDDVIWSFETVTRLYPLYANYYHNVTSVEKTGERELTFRFDQTGNRELPNIMGDLVVLPKHYWEGEDANGVKRNIDQPTLVPPLGSGPYRVKSFDTGNTVTWERVPDYWAKDHPTRLGRYNYDNIHYTYFRDANAAWEAFKRGGFSDYRAENSAGRWATGYDFPAFKDGRVIRKALPSGGAQPMQAYVLNTRKEKFADPRVRQALGLAFNFQEMNRTLFHGQYHRTESFFQNTELAATGLPDAAELEILEPLRDQLPPEVFTKEYTLPDYSAPNSEREYLRQAYDLLTQAGYVRRGSDLVNGQTGEVFSIEFLGDDPNDSRILEPFANQLKRLGIRTNVRIVDSSQYQALTDNFNFDIITGQFAQSLSPGNEQRDFWSSSAASQPGSRNLPGIRNPAVDAIIDKIVFAKNRDDLVAASRALDRVLLWNAYVVPQWHNPDIWMAYWNKLQLPERQPEYIGVDPFSWWIRPEGSN
ncbi:extracellular solute-binding protein [Aureimonas fodinaquatilis]|uniref:extracellular solute-binding protein n=1 Tax=Aureimonas fodinaquatilis TaxID=2565783 RepID=UPI001FE91098|nr:extracellular solute-binding protein [Aureimonas fodinaquatilis]